MLKRVYSNIPSFKSANFHSGLNLILADKSNNSSDGQTRNGAGKSSLVELISSLFGGELKKGSLLKEKELQGHRFGLELSVRGKPLIIEREGKHVSKIFVKETPEEFPKLQDLNGEGYCSNETWQNFLGRQFFGLSESVTDLKNSPTFRSLFSYFVRSSKGFDSPEKWFPLQSAWSVQVSLTYLLKLDWKIARDFEEVRQKEKLIKALKAASDQGTLVDIMGSASDLRTDIFLKNARVEKLRRDLSEFKVLPEYQEKEKRAALITKRLAELSADDMADKEWLTQLERSFEEESDTTSSRVENLFFGAYRELPEMVSRRFEEVAAFHESVVRNRREHLKQEIDELNARINNRYLEKSSLDNERSEILMLLQTHGALEQYMKFQTELGKLDAELMQLTKMLETTEDLDVKKSEIKIDRHNLLQKMRIDHSERDNAIREAVIAFAEISHKLYDEAGKIFINATDNGPKFEFDIPGKKSTGKSKMQIFCFDMMLMKLWAGEKNRPKILVHDSLVFDGVDERQIAKALIIGARMAEDFDFQYIVAMNSDDMPDMSRYKDFDINKYRIDLDLRDTKSGGLFGFRFG